MHATILRLIKQKGVVFLLVFAGSLSLVTSAEADRNFGYSNTVFTSAGFADFYLSPPGGTVTVNSAVEYISYSRAEIIIAPTTGTSITGYVRHQLFVGGSGSCWTNNGFPAFSGSVHWDWDLYPDSGCYPDSTDLSYLQYAQSGAARIDYWFLGTITCKAGYSGDPCQ
jgi:hypothetical protein